jgi:hypothetical protein
MANLTFPMTLDIFSCVWSRFGACWKLDLLLEASDFAVSLLFS